MNNLKWRMFNAKCTRRKFSKIQFASRSHRRPSKSTHHYHNEDNKNFFAAIYKVSSCLSFSILTWFPIKIFEVLIIIYKKYGFKLVKKKINNNNNFYNIIKKTVFYFCNI